MFNSEHIIQSTGLLGVALIVFAESGLLFGFIFPGDTLLLAAGFFAGQGKLPIVWLILLTVIAAIAGDNVGYQIGRRLGPRLFKRRDGILFRREYLVKTKAFYDRHGPLTIVLARFIAYVRTFAPVVAGVSGMQRRRFILFNIVGGVLWGVGLPLLGYFIGYSFPGIDKYFVWFLVISAHVLTILVLWHILRNPETRQRLKKSIRDEWRRLFRKKKINR